MTKKIIASLCFVFILVPLLFGQQSKILEERYLNGANEFYTEKNYKKAFEYINIILDNYNQSNLPQNIELLAETVYYSYLEQIRDEKNIEAFQTVKNRLLDFPMLSTERVARLVRSINTIENHLQSGSSRHPSEKEAIQAVVAAEQRAASAEAELASAQAELEKQKAVTAVREEMQMQRQSDSKEIENLLNRAADNNTVILRAVFITIALVIVVFIMILVISILNASRAKKQQKQFEATLQLVAKMARNSNERIGIASIADIYDDQNVRHAGTSKWTSELPKPEMSEEERSELRKLADICEKMGTQIDTITGRKNNSKNVAEMVFKIAHSLNLGSYDSMLYFCAAMVYDIGFLAIDPKLLLKETLTEDEKYIIRGHVQNGIKKLDFVPERYRPVFIDAVLMHHENMDGSGYPEGRAGERIPIIARLIHVVETFVSLVSRRNYRGIFDKESAIEEMRKQTSIYDQKIIDALDSLV